MINPPQKSKILQQIFKNSPLGIAAFDAAYLLQEVTPSFCKISTYGEQELIGLPLVDFVHSDDIDQAAEAAQQIFSGRSLSSTIEIKWLQKNGKTVWVKLMLLAVADETGHFSHGLAMIEEISAQKQMEEAYQFLRERMSQTEQLAAIGRLVSTFTHEINNSMHVVQGLLNLSLEELDDPVELSSYLNMSLTESAKVVDLVGRLRHSYRALPDPAESVDLNRLLEDTVTLAHRELKRREISVHTNFSANLPPITSRFNQLHLVFLSLILNMGDILANLGTGEIEICSGVSSGGVQVKLLGKTDDASAFVADLEQRMTEVDLSLSFSRDKLTELGGDLFITEQAECIVGTVELPLSIPENSTSI